MLGSSKQVLIIVQHFSMYYVSVIIQFSLLDKFNYYFPIDCLNINIKLQYNYVVLHRRHSLCSAIKLYTLKISLKVDNILFAQR